MGVYLQRGTGARVVWTVPDWEFIARVSDGENLSVTASLYRANGKLVDTYTPSSLGTPGTFTTGASPDIITGAAGAVEWGAGGYAAELYLIAGGVAVRARAVEKISATEFRLDVPIPFTSGDLIPASYLVAVPGSDLDFVGSHCRIEWRIEDTDSGEVRTYQQAVHVGRVLFAPAMNAQRAKEYALSAFPHASGHKPEAWYFLLAQRASERVERRVLASGRFPNLFGDSSLFADAGMVSLRIELAFEGLVPAAFDPQGYQQQQEDELTRQLEYATAQQWHDEDADGVVEGGEFAQLFSLPLRLS